MQAPQITVLMATYNGEEHVCEQIKSILNQTLPPTHLVILDDGSTDQTISNILSVYGSNPILTVGSNSKNLGVIATYENLLDKVETDFFALSDQDDVWLPQQTGNII